MTDATYSELAELIFPDAQPISYRFEKYPKRTQWIVTRMAPSPTWSIHTWAIYTSLVNQRFAEQSDWIFLLRIEDTDQKREVIWAQQLILDSMKTFGLTIHEWPIGQDGNDVWAYWPYTQSQRKDIYHSFAKHLIAEWKAYPCRMTADTLDSIREQQMNTKKVPWIYGNYSQWRNKSVEEYKSQYQKDPHCVIRFRSHGDVTKKIVFDDINRGAIHMTDNYNDNILIKQQDWLPTYHLAHIVDDTLMWTTHVIRWEERLTSVPWHLQLFGAFDLQAPTYCHLPSILTSENGKKRKLAKRKDPEANVAYLFEQWFAPQAIINYLMAIVDSRYEEWYTTHVETWNTPYHDAYKQYTLELTAMSSAWALFDLKKLTRRNNKYLSLLSHEELYTQACQWALAYDTKAHETLTRDASLALQALSMERLTDQDPKRFHVLNDIASQIEFFYDDIREKTKKNRPDIPESIDSQLIEKFADLYTLELDLSMDKQQWFDQLKTLGQALWFAANNKEFKEWDFRGKIWDIAMFLRIQLANSTQTPDLYSMMQVLGKEKVLQRIRS